MHFLPDVYVPCEVCKGKRYNAQTLEVKYKGKSIADVLEMRVDEAGEFFAAIPQHQRTSSRRSAKWAWATSRWASPRRSSPAAKRSASSSRPSCRAAPPAARSTCSTSRRRACTSPTSTSCSRCCSGWSAWATRVLVIEHNLDVIKTADYVIDLGPEGGDKGGNDRRDRHAGRDRGKPEVAHGRVPARRPLGRARAGPHPRERRAHRGAGKRELRDARRPHEDGPRPGRSLAARPVGALGLPKGAYGVSSPTGTMRYFTGSCCTIVLASK